MAVQQLISNWVSASSIFNLTTYNVLIIAVLTIIFVLAVKRIQYVRRVNKVPGIPGGYTILGNAVDMIGVKPDLFFDYAMAPMAVMNYPVVRIWGGPIPLFFVSKAEGFEVIMSSNKLIDKSDEYRFMHPWLGTGLLTSTGAKWQSRRKLLTPAFHFKILEDFVHVFNHHSKILIKQLDQAVQSNRDLNIYPFITRCTLDIICESAMGCSVNAQTDKESEYVKAVYDMGRIIQKRIIHPWLQPELLFKLTADSKIQENSLRILHGFTYQVIQTRKQEFKQRKAQNSSTSSEIIQSDDDGFLTKKRRLAFLDLLIEASEDGTVLSDVDIREEVDTFMFEGHDTTTAAINWSLLCIGSTPLIQELINEELERVFGDSDRPVAMADLSELKYLECCIKEALRLYPSVPIMGRTLCEDTNIMGYDIPAGCSVWMAPYMLHRDPTHFPDPELYKPERFFPENVKGRHPYAYVPFSAGARNCIGQKFALMEEKVLLASILRRFNVQSISKREELILTGELILRPRDGIMLRLIPKTN